jgi:hypothetical protein
MVVGLDPHLVGVLARTGVSGLIGQDNVIPRTSVFFEALDSAYDEATRWVVSRDHRSRADPPEGDPT